MPAALLHWVLHRILCCQPRVTDVRLLLNLLSLFADFRHFLEKCVMNNYFGIGLDAKISLEFNNKRDEHPKKCRLAGTPRFPPGKNMYPWLSSAIKLLGAMGVTQAYCVGDPSCSRFCTCTHFWDEHPLVTGCKHPRKGEDLRTRWDLLALQLERGTLPCWRGGVEIWVQHAAPLAFLGGSKN